MQLAPSDAHSPADLSTNPLVRKLSALVLLTAEETEFLDGLHLNRAEIAKSEDFVTEGEDFRSSFILQSGWAFRYRILEDGRRQIIGVLLPGDVVGLNVNFRRRATYSVAAKTACTVALIEPTRILEISQKFPVLASALSWVTVREYAILAEHVVRLGRRTAYERVAHLFLELFYRLDLVGLAEKDEYRLRMNQTDLSDILGISTVHVYRTLRRLAKDSLIATDAETINILDIKRLEEVADLPDAYLEDFAVL